MPYRKMDAEVSMAIVKARLDRVEEELRTLIRDTERLRTSVEDSLTRLRAHQKHMDQLEIKLSQSLTKWWGMR